MAKVSPSAPCPCGSGKKYKKCCRLYHKGVLPKDALSLMKSRYSAYAIGNSKYILNTTHPENSDYTADMERWRASVDTFCRNTTFFSLEILEFYEGEKEAFVKFLARLDSGDLVEKSRFVKEKGKWWYVDGVFEE